LDDRWRRETAYHLSMISAALNARATWDHSNAALWHRCSDLLATASHALQQRREPPPEFRPLFERIVVQLRSNPADDLDEGNLGGDRIRRRYAAERDQWP
jgi:hypothetical protein